MKFKGTIFTQMSLLAIKHGAINLGQGFPNFDDRFKKDTGLTVDPEKEVTVTSGCTEAIAATMLGLINPGDEISLSPWKN
ncbi:hypothetical protein K1719_007723 [Acacia pycnantha]|nr:hypothetical protein K1719_007723 [Acacia pycnantha]